MINLENITVKEDLRNYIRKITLFNSKGDIDYTQRIMPSMYSYLSYNAKDIPIFKSGELTQQPTNRLQIIGPKTDTEIVVEHKGTISQLIFEFKPTGFYALFNELPQHLCNKLNDYNYSNTNEALEVKLLQIHDIIKCSEIIQNHLIDFIENSIEVDERIQRAIGIIKQKKGVVKVKELSHDVNMGDRNFNRVFTETTGISPQIFIKIHQLHNIIANFANKKINQKLDIAFLSGFYDQPHFNRTFKKLVNLTPSQFLKSEEHISLEYYA